MSFPPIIIALLHEGSGLHLRLTRFLRPPESITQMASQSVQPFLHSSHQSVVEHVGACPSPSKLLLAIEDLYPIKYVVPRVHSTQHPKRHPDSAVCAQLMAQSPHILQWAPLSTKIAPSNAYLDPDLLHDCLGPCKPTTQMASRSIQPFLHSSPQSIPILYTMGCPFPSKLSISMAESRLVLLRWQEFATRSVVVFLLTCHRGAGGGVKGRIVNP